MTPEEFKTLVSQHDLTYMMSDDHQVWKKGNAQYRKILQAKAELGDAIAVPIWNEMVERCTLSSQHKEGFKWRITCG